MLIEEAEGEDPMSDSDEDDETAEIQSGLILIPDVISHLCKFLGISDIKKCRLVCKSWNDGATTVLKVRSIIAIQLYPENYTEGDPFRGEEEEKLTFGPVNLHVKISYKYSPEEYTIPRIDPKIYDAVRKLKCFFVQFITEHELQWQKDFCQKIILKSAPVLEKLKFQWDTYHDFPALCPLVFPKLKELVLLYGRLAKSKSFERIGHPITEAFPALEHLEIDARHLYELSKIELLPRFPLSLSSLKLSGNLVAEGMEALLKIPSALKRLVLGPISLRTTVQRAHELPPILYHVLRKHSRHLEKLEIDLAWEFDDPSDDLSDYIQPTLQWKFPVFPVLKNFEICTSYMFAELEFETGIGSGVFGRIDYNVCFPALENLTVSTKSNDIRYLAAFLTSQGRDVVVESVKKVEIKVLGSLEPNDFELVRATLCARLLEIFPNARDSIRITFTTFF